MVLEIPRTKSKGMAPKFCMQAQWLMVSVIDCRTPQKNPKDRYVKPYQTSVWEVAVQKSFSLEVFFAAG